MSWPAGANAPESGEDEALPRWGALAYPNYRRYWLATLSRVFGMQFRFIGSLWLANELTGSPAWLGMVGLANAIPTIVLSIPAGALADRADARKLIMIGQGLTAVAHLALAVLTVTEIVTIWMLLAWAVLVGVLAALTNPAQNALLPRLIDMRVIASAVAYVSSIWNSMRIIGPAIAGVLIAVVGTGNAFFVSAAGFAVSTVLIAALRLKPLDRSANVDDGGMLEGVRYIFRHRIFFATIGLSFFTSLFGMSYVVLLPIFADEILGGGARSFGLMETAAGAGGLLGTLAIVRIGTGPRSGQIMLSAAALFGLWIVAFAASGSLPLSMALLFAGGFSSSMYLNLGMTTLQLRVPDELRGRVMGVWGMTWFLSSVGGGIAGFAAHLLGTPLAVALGALSVSIFAVLLLVVSAELRRMPEPLAEPQPASG